MNKLTLLKTSWNTVNWKKFQIKVFKWQRQIYKATKDGDMLRTRRLQNILLNSVEAKFLAIRRVTQDNKGKKTAGIDKVKSLTPVQRVKMVNLLRFPTPGSPLRRVWIPKPGTDEKRPLGIPTIRDRCLQALMKLAMEPEWEAKFEHNSYGFRPGRNCLDAIVAIKNCVQKRPKYVLDADIAKCFDRIDHKALLDKIGFKGKYRRQIQYWLKSGVLDGNSFSETTKGTPQGGVISPLLANIALHGMETAVKGCFRDIPVYWASGEKVKPSRSSETVHIIRYADDFVILHDDLKVLLRCKECVENFLKGMGLELSSAKTRLSHTLELNPLTDTPELGFDGKVGFDFLGFTIKQFKTNHRSDKATTGEKLGSKTLIFPSKKSIKKHQAALHQVVLVQGKGLNQSALIKKLNSIIRGWAQYFGVSNANTTGHLGKQDYLVYLKLRKWGLRKKGTAGKATSYWFKEGTRNWIFGTPNGARLLSHIDFSKKLGASSGYVKVKAEASPFDGNQVYWAKRLGTYPTISKRISILLRKQKGACTHCKLQFLEGDVWEVDHINPRRNGGSDTVDNLQLLHVHCHDVKTKGEAKMMSST